MRLPPSGDVVSGTPQLLASARVRRWGGSHVVTIDRYVREALGLKAGDRVAFRKVGKYVVIALERACSVIPVSEEERRQARAVLG